MLTIIVLVVVALIAAYAIARPVLTHIRNPWLFDAPSGEEESLRQEQIMALDALRDLAMDYRMGQISEEDYRSLAAPLQKRAKQTLEDQMGGGGSFQSPKQGKLAELDAELEAAILALRNVGATDAASSSKASAGSARFCTQCGEKIESSFRFCASCGAELPSAQAETSSDAEAAAEIKDEARTVLDGQSATNLASKEPQTASVSQSVATAPPASSAESTQSTPVQSGSTQSASAQSSMRRWWIASGIFTAIWIVAIIWIYLNGRAGQETQIPLTTLPDSSVVALAATAEQALVSSTAGLVASDDLETWAQLSTEDVFLSVIPLDGISGQPDEQAGTHWLAVGPLGLWRSSDGAETWSSVESQTAELGIQQLGVGIGTAVNSTASLWGASANAIYQSADLGETWTLVGDSLPGSVRAIAVGPTDLFIGTNQGVFRSPDTGESWIDSNSVVNGRIGSTDVQALAFDEEGRNLFAGTPQGLYFINLDSMGGWGRRSLEANVQALTIPAGMDNILWVGTAQGQVFRSTDRGVTWRN